MPVEFSTADAVRFVDEHQGDHVSGGPILAGAGTPIVTVGDYVFMRAPPYGVIVREGADDILVWYDASNRLHVINVTGHPIAEQVAKAPYESPNSGFVEDLLANLNTLVSGALGSMVMVAAVVGAVMLFSRRN